jgi:hypothetical protein
VGDEMYEHMMKIAATQKEQAQLKKVQKEQESLENLQKEATA